jgi:putative DNA primase/helicase
MNLIELSHLDLWCGWRAEDRGEGLTKIPYNSRVWKGGAKSNDPKTWSNLEEARAWVALRQGSGIGIFMAPIGNRLNLCGIDLDTCRDPSSGELKPWATEVLQLIPSYTEISPSQTGCKIFYLMTDEDHAAVLKAAGGKSSAMFSADLGVHAPAIELHFANRFFTVTGVPLRPEDAGFTLATVGADALLHVLGVLGPALAKTCPERPVRWRHESIN